jgi:hypothetical protein
MGIGYSVKRNGEAERGLSGSLHAMPGEDKEVWTPPVLLQAVSLKIKPVGRLDNREAGE